MIASVILLAPLVAALPDIDGIDDVCSTTAAIVLQASRNEAREDLLVGYANCINFVEEDDQEECLDEILGDYADTLEEVAAQFEARLALCALLGEDAYDPDPDEDDFVRGVDNRYLPWIPGSTWTYEKRTDEGLEVIVITVLDETIVIDEVECVVVRDTVTLDGELVEDTRDYYAQDREGDVWYFGEISINYEDGEIADLDGSWEAGEEFAKPGIVMFDEPEIGTTYRQEFLIDEAEDAATILADGLVITVRAGTFTDCLQTEDFTPLEPEALEYKFYAPGVGLVLETDPRSGEMLELVSFVAGG